MFPTKCANQPSSTGTSSGNASNCVQCFSYNAEQQCPTGLNQCAWLGYPAGDALTPHANTMILLFTCSTLFAIGDAVWETQLPSVLQTIFKDDSSKVTQSISNLKMFQSIGVTLLFAFSFISDDIQLISMLLLIACWAKTFENLVDSTILFCIEQKGVIIHWIRPPLRFGLIRKGDGYWIREGGGIGSGIPIHLK